MRNRVGIYSALSFLSLAFAAQVSAQDNNYWSNQYGSRSSLMGGAVVAGVEDSSAGYYNPAGLGFIENPDLAVSANAYKYEQTSLSNGVGTGGDLDSEEVNVIPLMVAGVFIPDYAEGHVIGYSLLTKSRTTFNASERKTASIDVLKNPFSPGLEDYIGQYAAQANLTEVWGGLSYAYKPCKEYSFGLTNFLAYRQQDFSETIYGRAVNQTNPNTLNTAASTSAVNYDYKNLRLLWKAGTVMDFDPIKIGIVGTTPSVDIYGDGTVGGDFTVNNVDFDGDGVPNSFIGDDRQDDLDAHYRSPASLAAGIQYEVDETTKIEFATEWFGGQGEYAVITPDSRQLLLPTTANFGVDSAEFLQLHGGADNVVNYALAGEHAFTDKFTGIVSLRTDFESRQAEGTGISAWDIYHLTVGGIIKGKKSDLSLGVVYSYASQGNFTQPTSFANPTESQFLFDAPGKASVDYDAVSIILGYTYYLG